MKTFLTAILALLIVGMVIATTIIIVDWYDVLEYNDIRLSFRSFRKFYAIAPEKYKCYSDYIRYRPDPCHGYNIAMNTPFDHARYLLWQHRHTRRKEQATNAKVMQKYLDSVRKDIENYTEKGVKSRSD